MISRNGLNELSQLFENTNAIAGLLFGSMARGDYDSRSDADVLLIYSKKEELEEDKIIFDKLPAMHGREVQVIARTLDELEESDRIFLRNVFRDGVLLFLRGPLHIEASKLLGLSPYRIFVYRMENLEDRRKKMLIHALYGYSTKKKVKEKVYEYTYHGLVENELKLGKNSFLVPETKAREVEEIFKNYGVRHMNIRVWVEEY